MVMKLCLGQQRSDLTPRSTKELCAPVLLYYWSCCTTALQDAELHVLLCTDTPKHGVMEEDLMLPPHVFAFMGFCYL